jgi:NADPH:quinone reductase
VLAQAVLFRQHGGPEVLQVETVSVPDPREGELTIAVEAFALNRADTFFREGWHPIKPEFPSRIGYEAAGRVAAIGNGVSGFAVGDRVATLPVMEVNRYGGYGEAMTVPARLVVSSPAELGPAESAAVWASYMTAYGALVDLVTIEPGQWVLCTAASSSVANAAIQICLALGAKPIGVTRTQAKASAVRDAGATEVVVTEDEDLVTRVMQITDGAGVAYVFDPVAGPNFGLLAEAAAPHGTIILYGATSPEPTQLPVITSVNKNLMFKCYAMLLEEQPDRDERAQKFIRDGIAAGWLRPRVGHELPFSEMRKAVALLDSMKHSGKIVVRISD